MVLISDLLAPLEALEKNLLSLVACGHEVMVRRPGLFNEALTGFYRSTESVARRRAGESPAGDDQSGTSAPPAAEPATSL